MYFFKIEEKCNTYCNTGNSEVIIAEEVFPQCSKRIKCCTIQNFLSNFKVNPVN